MNNIYLIGVSGGSGSGKTTFVHQLTKKINHPDLKIIYHDSYYKDRSSMSSAEIQTINFDHPDALDTNLLLEQLKRLDSGKSIEVPIYDFARHARSTNTMTIQSAQVVILEGILLFIDDKLRDLIDLKICMDVDDNTKFLRRLQRDLNERQRSVDSIIVQYCHYVKPMQDRYEPLAKKYADLLIPINYSGVLLDVIAAFIKSKLKDNHAGRI